MFWRDSCIRMRNGWLVLMWCFDAHAWRFYHLMHAYNWSCIQCFILEINHLLHIQDEWLLLQNYQWDVAFAKGIKPWISWYFKTLSLLLKLNISKAWTAKLYSKILFFKDNVIQQFFELSVLAFVKSIYCVLYFYSLSLLFLYSVFFLIESLLFFN